MCLSFLLTGRPLILVWPRSFFATFFFGRTVPQIEGLIMVVFLEGWIRAVLMVRSADPFGLQDKGSEIGKCWFMHQVLGFYRKKLLKTQERLNYHLVYKRRMYKSEVFK